MSITTELETTSSAWTGRKGIAYDWQSVVAEVAATGLDADLGALGTQAFALAES